MGKGDSSTMWNVTKRALSRPITRVVSHRFFASEAVERLHNAMSLVQEEIANHRLNPTDSLDLNLMELNKRAQELKDSMGSVERAGNSYKPKANAQLEAALQTVQEEIAQQRLNPTESFDMNMIDLQQKAGQLKSDMSSFGENAKSSSQWQVGLSKLQDHHRKTRVEAELQGAIEQAQDA